LLLHLLSSMNTWSIRLFGFSCLFSLAMNTGNEHQYLNYDRYNLGLWFKQQQKENQPSSICRMKSEIGAQSEKINCLVEKFHFKLIAKPIKIAVVDTGIDVTHPYLRGYVSLEGVSTTNTHYLIDQSGHGTHVAGIIISRLEELFDQAKVVAPIEIISVKYIEYSSDSAVLTRSMLSLARHTSDLTAINISASGFGRDQYEKEIFNYWSNLAIPIFVAAGNNALKLDRKHEVFPCSYRFKNVTCVGNIQEDFSLASTSNFGDPVRVYDFGTRILSTAPGGGVQFMTGTSQASPRALASFVFLKLTNTSEEKVIEINQKFTRAISSQGHDLLVINVPLSTAITSF